MSAHTLAVTDSIWGKTNEIQKVLQESLRCENCLLLSQDVIPDRKQGHGLCKVLLCPSLPVLLRMNFHGQSDFHTKHFLVSCQRGFRQCSSTILIFFLIVSPHLSLYYLSPLPVPPSLLLASLPASLSAEWLVEMDIMRQVHAGREMEAVPWSGAAVNKVKNNQVRVDCSSLRGCCSQAHQPAQQRNNTSLSSLEITLFFFTFSQLSLAPLTVQLFVFFVYLFWCLSWFSTGSPSCLLSADLIIPINHFLHLSLRPLQVQV